MASELARLGLAVERQKPLPVVFNGMVVDVGYRLDPVVEQRVVLEVKAVEKLGRIHTAQMLTYLRFSGCSVGLLLNFNVLQMKDGIRRVVLGLKE